MQNNQVIPLYHRILGDQWALLPNAIRELHHLNGEKIVAGRASVERGRGLIPLAIAALFGFPKSSADVAVRVKFTSSDGREIWCRSFGDESFFSTQCEGYRHDQKLIAEKFGPVTFGLVVELEGGRLYLRLRRWDFSNVPLPSFLAPISNAYEVEEDGKFRFHVEISLPIIGLIVRYRGWLA